MAYTLYNDLSVKPINCNVGYNNSWLHVQNNADRELFAQASYITNFDDLTISLSAVLICKFLISNIFIFLYAILFPTKIQFFKV